MKKIISILLLVSVLLSSFTFTAFAETETIITTSDALCTLSPLSSWTESTNANVKGPNGGTSWHTSNKEATAGFQASQLSGSYGVYTYLTPWGTTADLVDVTVTASGKAKTITISATEGGQGNRHWVFLGIYNFNGGSTDGVVHQINSKASSGSMRVSGVKFIKDDTNSSVPGNINNVITLEDNVPVILDTAYAGFNNYGSWSVSGIKLTDATAYYTSNRGSYATWNIDVGNTKDVEISIPKTSVVDTEDSATEFEIYAGDVTKTVTVDFTKGVTGWYSLGKYDFTGGGEEYVKVTKTTSTGNTRAIGIRLAVNEIKNESAKPSILVGNDLHIFERMGMFTQESITDNYLDKKITRADMADMLTRLFGKVDDITSENNTDNFADVPDNFGLERTLAYIKAHPEFGIKRHGKNSFSPNSYASKAELVKFILHQLGYYEVTDYKPNQAYSKANELGIVTSGSDILTPRTMAQILYSAFEIPLKNDSDITFFQKLVRENSGIEDADLFNRKPLGKLLDERKSAKNKERGIIYNNDGNDVYKGYPEYPEDYPVTDSDRNNISTEAFLKTRTDGIVDSQVKTIYYCTGVVNSYTHTSSGETDTRKRDWSYLLEEYTGKDTLKTMIDYGDANDIDVFWSMRMNDTHDYAYEENQLDSWKQANLDKLVARKTDAIFMQYGERRWSTIDYTYKESRQKIYNILKDTVSRYDVDGIELDFSRWPLFFKEVTLGYKVYPENVERMNDFMRMVRALTDMYSVKRNKPILISIYVPDSIDFCKEEGLDIKTWMEEDLFDIAAVGCHIGAFQSWEDVIDEYKVYGVPVYAALDELNYSYTRYNGDDENDERFAGNEEEIKRIKEDKNKYKLWIDTNEASLAYAAGAKGVYTYNYFNINHVRFDVLGSKATCDAKIKDFSTILDENVIPDFSNYTSMRKIYSGRYAKGSGDYVTLK